MKRRNANAGSNGGPLRWVWFELQVKLLQKTVRTPRCLRVYHGCVAQPISPTQTMISRAVSRAIFSGNAAARVTFASMTSCTVHPTAANSAPTSSVVTTGSNRYCRERSEAQQWTTRNVGPSIEGGASAGRLSDDTNLGIDFAVRAGKRCRPTDRPVRMPVCPPPFG